MRIVVQRVAHASVRIDGVKHSEIHEGLLILLGVGHEDEEEDVDYLVKKVAALRIFPDSEGVMNLSVLDVGGDCMVVSQFTLMASTRKGNRPSYIRAAAHEKSIPMYEMFVHRLSEVVQRTVATGEFGADMKVELLNDGPVTIIIDSKEKDF